ncbi:hypothetical protein WDU94_014538 [Cyamophila willieti]
MHQHHHSKTIILLSALITLAFCDSQSGQASDNTNDQNDPHFVDNKLDEIKKKTDQVKGFIDDIPKFLQSIHDIEKAEKALADNLGSDVAKIKAAQAGGSRKKRGVEAGESFKADNVNVMSKDELVHQSIDYINNTLPEVKSKLVSILETYLKANSTPHPSTYHPYENDSDFVFPSLIPQSTLSATLHKYNISLQNEKRELLNLENVILKMQNIVESALLEIYKLEDSLIDDTHDTAAAF